MRIEQYGIAAPSAAAILAPSAPALAAVRAAFATRQGVPAGAPIAAGTAAQPEDPSFAGLRISPRAQDDPFIQTD
jgi:hypothetical protein